MNWLPRNLSDYPSLLMQCDEILKLNLISLIQQEKKRKIYQKTSTRLDNTDLRIPVSKYGRKASAAEAN